ncbi:MAG: polymer-forming cytoskeletal protein [bacterium]|nr:polymer-forming cytoskeletal protein [bacterium]
MAVFKKHENVKQSNFSTVSPTQRSNSIVGKTLFIKGEISSDEEIIVEGKIEGKLNIKHRVVVGKSGVVNADIEAREIIIKGTVNGNVKGSYKVEIVPEGILNGNILSQRVVLAEGAIFKGNIDMTVKEGSAPPKITGSLNASNRNN